MPSRNRNGSPNIRVTVAALPNQFGLSESVAMLVTEYGVAHLTGRTVRERAQALIDIAHPEDRAALVEQAKAAVAFVVDEAYQGKGIAAYLYRMLIRLARQRGIQGFHADVLSSNRNMLKVFEKGGLPAKASLEDGVYSLWMPFGPVAENDALNRP